MSPQSAVRNALRPLLALVLGCLLLSGCAALSLQAPDITLVNLEFTDLTLFETSGIFEVRLANENPEPLRIEGGVYSLYVDGLRIGKGLSNRQFEIAPFTTVIDTVDVHVNNLAMATRLQSIFDSGAFSYRIKAKIHVATDLGRRSLNLSKDGHFDFDEAETGRSPLDSEDAQ